MPHRFLDLPLALISKSASEEYRATKCDYLLLFLQQAKGKKRIGKKEKNIIVVGATQCKLVRQKSGQQMPSNSQHLKLGFLKFIRFNHYQILVRDKIYLLTFGSYHLRIKKAYCDIEVQYVMVICASCSKSNKYFVVSYMQGLQQLEKVLYPISNSRY